MQESGQYSINTGSGGLCAVACIGRRLVSKSDTDSDNVRMEGRVTLSEKFSQNDFDC